MAKYSPVLWNIVAMQYKAPTATDPGEENPEEREEQRQENQPLWCECGGHCREMEKQEERICCKNAFKNHEHPLFENHILTEHNLELAMQNNADFLNYPFDPYNNECWRYTSYRQYILWVWGKLGRRNRKVIPSCIVCKIRDRFPDPNGKYTGFMDVDYYA